ncbi:AAA family ATPase [Pseudomonas sp. S31]|uniref:AAA family ATPase n=1 Tax=Pseudomonas sp. S31 TaxID=1564473 RepID=UPI0019145533|nr:AAA family ATPase [Pseudomonas sp. S31]MBK4998883.1 AAA family ATPase [Pseudomonas sp. S31]
MDKRVIFAVAGSGKTTHLISKLSLEKRALIITYTENNYSHLRSSIMKKFGTIPSNITVMTYFAFLHGFCFRPFMQNEMNTRGLNFRRPPQRNYALTDRERYRDPSGRLYHNRLAKLIEVEGLLLGVKERIERFYDSVYVDEVQDFAGHDFNLLLQVSAANTEMLFVGDFYQHTFDTSRDGSVNITLHDDITKYEKRFAKAKIKVDKETLSKSWRCGTTVCDFISAHLQIKIDSHKGRVTQIIKVDSQELADRLHADHGIVKLFQEQHYKYGCYSQNWGASKGQDHYEDVCVVLGIKAWKQYLDGKLHEALAQTRNKLYVAFSRARGEVYVAPDKLFKAYKS